MSKVSDLNAFDQALRNAKIGELNLVSVSSVLPIGAKKVVARDLPMGCITHCVLAQMRGGEGEMISAGIAYAFRKDGKGGYVAEGHMHGTKKALKEVLEWKMNEMANHAPGRAHENILCRRGAFHPHGPLRDLSGVPRVR